MFYANNADTNDSGNIAVPANNSDIEVILMCNIHHNYNYEHTMDITMKTIENVSVSRN